MSSNISFEAIRKKYYLKSNLKLLEFKMYFIYNPPLAKILLVPIIIVFTLEIIVKIAESGISVTSKPIFIKLEANS